MIYVIAAIAAFFILKKKPVELHPSFGAPALTASGFGWIGPHVEEQRPVVHAIPHEAIGEAWSTPGHTVGDQNDPEPHPDTNEDVSWEEMYGYVEKGAEVAGTVIETVEDVTEAIEEGESVLGAILGW